MKFEYDPYKSMLNQQKHGLSLEEAKRLWSVSHVEIQARTIGESRWMIIGKMDNKCYSCVFTMRATVIRLISARRSSKREEIIYDNNI